MSEITIKKNKSFAHITLDTFISFRRGSVIALFTVEYNTIDRDQIVTFKAELLKQKYLTNMSIDENEIEIVIPDGKYFKF